MKKSIIMQVDEVTASIMQGIQKDLTQSVTDAAMQQVQPVLTKMDAQSAEIAALLDKIGEGGTPENNTAIDLEPLLAQNEKLLQQAADQRESNQHLQDAITAQLAKQQEAIEALSTRQSPDNTAQNDQLTALKQDYTGLLERTNKLQEATDKIVHGMEVLAGQLKQMDADHKERYAALEESKSASAEGGSLKDELELISRRIGELREAEFSQVYMKLDTLTASIKTMSETQELHDQYLQVIHENVEGMTRKKLFGKTKK